MTPSGSDERAPLNETLLPRMALTGPSICAIGAREGPTSMYMYWRVTPPLPSFTSSTTM